MREIKFRAWDEHDKKMWNPDEGVDWNNNFYINPKKKLESKIYGWSHSEKLIMQFTGLKDKNGVEIYEGDVLYFPYFGENSINNRIVEFEDGAFYGTLIRNQFGKMLSDLNTECEVIGNIHENPELLKVQNG